MSFRTALDRIVAIQGAITVAAPVSTTIKKAYKYPPDSSKALPDLPCFINTWTMQPMVAAPSLRTLRYEVTMTCAVNRVMVENERTADIATALFEKMLDDFGADISLAQNVTLALLRGGDPTLVEVEHGGQKYIGFQAVLDIQISSAFTWS